MTIDEFVKNHKFPGEVVFGKVWGSRSHNTALPTSDTDFLVVYAAPTANVLGLSPPPDTMDGKDPDYQAHEVYKFSQLLLKGNPGVIEMLFTDRECISSIYWDELRSQRKRFLTGVTVKQYLGYAEGQLKRLKAHEGKKGLHTKGGKYNEKWAYHAVRLLGDAHLIAQGKEPIIWKEGEERDLLMTIRGGDFPLAQAEALIQNRIDKIDQLKPWPIPDEMDAAFLNQWLLWVRGVGGIPYGQKSTS